MKYLERNIIEAANFLKGLANADRLMVLCVLSEGERSVTSLMEKTGIAQTSMSQHLSKLKEEEIVDFRREHRTLYYYICDTKVSGILNILHAAYCNNKKPRKKLER